MHKFAIFGSGSGSNALNILNHFQKSNQFQVGLVITNRKGAGILQHAAHFQVPSLHIPSNEFKERPRHIVSTLRDHQIDFIVLAGFLLKIPDEVVEAFDGKMVNIHPSLLPAFGGSGMYGDKVHEAVLKSGVSESGITIHFVNEHYDEGKTIFQAKVEVRKDDTAQSLRERIQKLEHQWFPLILEKIMIKIFKAGAH